jgi:hypothetical protein
MFTTVVHDDFINGVDPLSGWPSTDTLKKFTAGTVSAAIPAWVKLSTCAFRFDAELVKTKVFTFTRP